MQNQIWFKMQSTMDTTTIKDLETYLIDGNCQTVINNCANIPTTPRPRQYHTAIYYKTYNKTQEDSMCPSNQCGPLCHLRDPSCLIPDIDVDHYPLPGLNEGLEDFLGPTNSACPNQCCKEGNEYCFRKYDNTGHEIERDEEMMLVFGGLTQNEVTIDGKNIADNCTLQEDLKLSTNFEKALNTLYLVNNCGYEIMNELWSYNIKKNIWTYVKPYVDAAKVTLQQKPTARYGHASVYVELIDTTDKDIPITRKYMFVYGGFSIYCQNACDDMWRYEIAYAPQRYYPDPSLKQSSFQSTGWNRGNVWTEMYPSSINTPGKRMFHTMIVDKDNKNIYLFGGISVDSEGNYILHNDLWKFDLELNVWEKISTLGIKRVVRPIIYWDGSYELVQLTSDEEFNEKTDFYELGSIFDTPLPKYPAARSGNTMEIFTRGKDGQSFILIFGGYTWETTQNYNLQKQLNDMWVYSLEGKSWLQVYPNSDDNPGERYGATMKWIDESKFLMYGGMNSGSILNDLWLFNMDSNMWTKIVRTNAVVNEDDWPMPVKFPSLIKFSRGLVLYGGAYYVNTDTSVYSFYSDPDTINTEGSSYTYYDSQSQTSSNRLNYILNDLWILYSDVCPRDCNKKGECNYGRCICQPGYFEATCEVNECSGSFCYTDLEIFVSQQCYHCSGHGSCHGKKCQCDSGWRGDDCSIQDCPNNCSADVDPNYGTCVEIKPISQCECNQTLKRGGDDCSVVFCMNDCTTNGQCDYSKGTCTCNSNFYGLDCSVFVPLFRASASLLTIHPLISLLIIFLIIFQ